MDENAPRTPKPNIGNRLLRRQAAVTRASGLRLGRSVAARHEQPEPVRAAMRLVPKPAGLARAAAAAPAAAAPAEPAWEPSPVESTITPGISDWGAEWLFGDADRAVATGSPFMGGAGITPPTPEQKRLARVKHGGPEVARAAKIFEGDERPPAPPAPSGPAGEAPAPAAARFAAEPPTSTPALPHTGSDPVPASRTPATPPPAPTRVSRTPVTPADRSAQPASEQAPPATPSRAPMRVSRTPTARRAPATPTPDAAPTSIARSPTQPTPESGRTAVARTPAVPPPDTGHAVPRAPAEPAAQTPGIGPASVAGTPAAQTPEPTAAPRAPAVPAPETAPASVALTRAARTAGPAPRGPELPRMAMHHAAAPAAVSPTPVLAGFPAAIARAGLGAVDGGGDTATVMFPAPGSAPFTISRRWGGLTDAVEHAASDGLHQLENRGSELAHDAAGRAEHAVSDAAHQAEHAVSGVAGQAEHAVSQAGQAASKAAGALGAAAASAAGAGDKLFEDLYDRLKRELLIEQEQLGQLFHEP